MFKRRRASHLIASKHMAHSIKLLIKILIGAAWIDGKVQLEERQYLHRIAQENGLAEDPDIKPLLHELRSVSAEECYQWIQEYLGDQPASADCQQLLEAISGLIYSDGTIANEEAKLLTRLQMLDARCESDFSHISILTTIRALYKHYVSRI
jgi:uncharacterized tellurite resistance protein B-like protein